jgi:hypothetical protein
MSKKQLIEAGFICPVCDGPVKAFGLTWRCPRCHFTMARRYKTDPNRMNWTPSSEYYQISHLNYKRRAEGLKEFYITTCGRLGNTLVEKEKIKVMNEVVKLFLANPQTDLLTILSPITKTEIEAFKVESQEKLDIGIYLPSERETYKHFNR